MGARKARQWLVLMLLVFTGVPVLMTVWIGILLVMPPLGRDPAAAALNLVLVIVLAAALPLWHRAMYRWMWHVDRRRVAGTLAYGEEPAYGSEPTEPVPRIPWPPALRLRHLAFHLAGSALLLLIFAPYEHQLRFLRFVAAHSAGEASAGSLGGLLFLYLPMIGLTGLVALLTWRQMRKRNAGSLGAWEQLLLYAELKWLFAYVAAFCTTILLCRMAGGMIAAYL